MGRNATENFFYSPKCFYVNENLLPQFCEEIYFLIFFFFCGANDMEVFGIDSEKDPNYPNALDVSQSAGKTCTKYPARRCGGYVVTCNKCSSRIAYTTSGRTDAYKK